MDEIGKGIGTALVFLCISSAVVILGGKWLVDLLFIEDAIRTTEPITPQIELVVKDNNIDTIYVYRKP